MKEENFFTKEEQKILDSGDNYLETNYFNKDGYIHIYGKSYIIKVPIKNNTGDIVRFVIAERNETWIDREIGSPRSVSWWEIPGELVRKNLLQDFQILKEVELSNVNHQDQKALNLCKKVFCKEEGIPLEENKQCDIILSASIKNKINIINKSYKDIINSFDVLGTKSKISSIMYKLVTTKKYEIDRWCKLKRWQIRKGKMKGDIVFDTEDEYIVFIVMKDYILDFARELDKKTWGLYDQYEWFWDIFKKDRDYVKKMIALTSYTFDRRKEEITYNKKPLKEIRSTAFVINNYIIRTKTMEDTLQNHLPVYLWVKLDGCEKKLNEYESYYLKQKEELRFYYSIDNKCYGIDKHGNVKLMEK